MLSAPLAGVVERERISDGHRHPARGLRELDPADNIEDATLDSGVPDRARAHRHLRGAARAADHECGDDLAREIGLPGIELALVAVAELIAMRTDRRLDRIAIDRAD